MSIPPSVSCLMPTRGRHHLLPAAVANFLAQDVPDAELVIVSEDGIPDSLSAAIATGRVRHVSCPAGLSLGAKRNMAAQAAQGQWLVHWDDDDHYAHDRLQRQLDALRQPGVALCGSSRIHFKDQATGRHWEYHYGGERKPWVYGATLAYTRDYWQSHPFRSVDVGEDNFFVWDAPPSQVRDLDDPSLVLCAIHDHNTSPKATGNSWWRAIDAPSVAPSNRPALSLVPTPELEPLSNVYACLVHERLDCVIDLVRNLRGFDPDSRIVLYDGSPRGDLIDVRLPWSRWGVEICPNPRPMAWGKLHDFALDCMRYLNNGSPDWDAMTIVDSDQIALRSGYPAFLARMLEQRPGLGLLSSDPSLQGASTRIPPAVTAQQEIDLWRPFLQRFPHGEQQFVHWTFWPSTVLFKDACTALINLFDHDTQLQAILAKSRLWATEEVLFPTLTALLGFRVEQNPCSDRYVKYKVPYSSREVDAALRESTAFWMHPVPRIYADPIRTRVRQLLPRPKPTSGQQAAPHPLQLSAIIKTMRGIEGWLEDDEAELLAITAREALNCGDKFGTTQTACTAAKTIVEVGSHCGKATYVLASMARASQANARVVAVDTFNGTIGSLTRPVLRPGSTLDKFKRTLEQTGIQGHVDTMVGQANHLASHWEGGPVHYLLVDGLHDYASVVQDFYAFEPHLSPDARVAFHDCADYFPDVGRFVDELIDSGQWREIAQAGSLRVLQRKDGQTQAMTPLFEALQIKAAS